jgi:hypothetical protein
MFGMFLVAGNHQSHPILMGFHHHINCLRCGEIGDSSYQYLNYMLHPIVIVIVQQHFVVGRESTDCGWFLDRFGKAHFLMVDGELIESIVSWLCFDTPLFYPIVNLIYKAW